jgi:hypothetical protein
MSGELEGSNHGLTEVLSWHLLKTSKTSVSIATVQAKIQTKHLLNTSLEYNFQMNLYDEMQVKD